MGGALSQQDLRAGFRMLERRLEELTLVAHAINSRLDRVVCLFEQMFEEVEEPGQAKEQLEELVGEDAECPQCRAHEKIEAEGERRRCKNCGTQWVARQS